MIYTIITALSLTIEMMHESHLYCKTNVSLRERETLQLVKGTLIKLSLLDKWLSFSP